MLDLEFANEVFTPEGQAVDKGAAKAVRAEDRAQKAEMFRKHGRARR